MVSDCFCLIHSTQYMVIIIVTIITERRCSLIDVPCALIVTLPSCASLSVTDSTERQPEKHILVVERFTVSWPLQRQT